VREPEGDRSAATRKVIGKAPVKTPRATHSQCRGRGFESHHLHQESPVQRTDGGISVKARPPKKGWRVFMADCGPQLDGGRDGEKATEPGYPGGRHDHPTPERPVAPAGVHRRPPGHLRDLSHLGFGR
jgi:hypothetical protein